ncbi:cysteine hydrolase family protein [Nanoarchaeota archaeon]
MKQMKRRTFLKIPPLVVASVYFPGCLSKNSVVDPSVDQDIEPARKNLPQSRDKIYTPDYSNIEEYVSANPDFSPRFGVILVDLQEGFLEKISREELKQELPYIVEVLQHCADNYIPVAALEFQGYGRTIQVLRNEIEKVPQNEYFTKYKRNGFTNSMLAAQLNEWDVNFVFLMGAFASGCVVDTAGGALDSGLGIATSRNVILDEANFPDKLMIDFYFKQKGLYSDNHRDFFQYMKNKELARL